MKYEIKASDGAIVVFMTKANVKRGRESRYGGSGMFSFRVEGEVYSLIEKPFLGKHPVHFYGAIGIVVFFTLLIVCSIVCCCNRCKKSKGGSRLD